MSTTYQPADQKVHHAAARLRKEYHKDLDEAGVTVCYLMAFAPTDKQGTPKGPSIKLHGYPCAAIVKVNNLLLRAQGVMDCTIIIDGDEWSDRPDEEKLAIIDHELEHIEVTLKRRDNEGHPIFETDDLGRPVTNLKNHDFHGGGFKSVMHRHQGAALETKMVIDASLKMQTALTFDPTPAVAEKMAAEPTMSFGDAVRKAVAEGRLKLGADHPAAFLLKRNGQRERVLADGEVVQS